MNNQKVELKYAKTGHVSNRQNPEAIKAVLSELTNDVNADDLVLKYRLSSIKTLKEWQKRFRIGKEIISHVIKLSDKEKRIIVFEINAGKTTIDEVINHYKVSSASVKAWVKLYTCDTELEMPKVEKTEEEKVTDKNSQKLIDELKLKVLGLETMIDIAEEKFKIDIRKKSGTKQ